MTMNDEQFFAWIDGELAETEATAAAAQVAADPDLQRRAAAHRGLTAQLRGAFEPVASAPVPEAILQSVRRGTIVDLAAARERKAARFRLPTMAQWAAMAATLVLGLVTGSMLDVERQAPVRSSGGQLVASAKLKGALDVRLASAPDATGPRIGLTFRDEAGSICRSFSDASAQGLACRAGSEWQIRGMFQGSSAAKGEYRMAAGTDPALSALIDSTMSGEPFDAEAERKALGAGWR